MSADELLTQLCKVVIGGKRGVAPNVYVMFQANCVWWLLVEKEVCRQMCTLCFKRAYANDYSMSNAGHFAGDFMFN